ncbi:hypothetical protein M885DRAFT_519117 [Pelagophyceae sp. CCMP2097]|nr:hypothetical protein M885DRAFT_519117 [Pelagophyceae sp. CCMP2097]
MTARALLRFAAVFLVPMCCGGAAPWWREAQLAFASCAGFRQAHDGGLLFWGGNDRRALGDDLKSFANAFVYSLVSGRHLVHGSRSHFEARLEDSVEGWGVDEASLNATRKAFDASPELRAFRIIPDWSRALNGTEDAHVVSNDGSAVHWPGLANVLSESLLWQKGGREHSCFLRSIGCGADFSKRGPRPSDGGASDACAQRKILKLLLPKRGLSADFRRRALGNISTWQGDVQALTDAVQAGAPALEPTRNVSRRKHNHSDPRTGVEATPAPTSPPTSPPTPAPTPFSTPAPSFEWRGFDAVVHVRGLLPNFEKKGGNQRDDDMVRKEFLRTFNHSDANYAHLWRCAAHAAEHRASNGAAGVLRHAERIHHTANETRHHPATAQSSEPLRFFVASDTHGVCALAHLADARFGCFDRIPQHMQKDTSARRPPPSSSKHAPELDGIDQAILEWHLLGRAKFLFVTVKGSLTPPRPGEGPCAAFEAQRVQTRGAPPPFGAGDSYATWAYVSAGALERGEDDDSYLGGALERWSNHG